MYSEEVLSRVQDQWMEDIRKNPAFLMTNNSKPMAELSPPRLSCDDVHRFNHLNAEYERFLSSIGAPNYAPEISPMKTKVSTSRKSFGNQLEAENYPPISHLTPSANFVPFLSGRKLYNISVAGNHEDSDDWKVEESVEHMQYLKH
ncbi:CLUMA_CG007007, isoform A [Clunio marinus]|uniref:CLUMA_CG007007, isoform A n=1 Tax=Clunio marinus TaxID=568069 RepID=A0A1J1HZD8_9DIPT|nr:CLUMA_CG007007, isoform A [Clunio marinus]